jgi:hypothetical protein
MNQWLKWSFAIVVLALATPFLALFTVWLRERSLREERRSSAKDLREFFGTVATASSLITSVVALIFAFGIQLRNEDATRRSNEEAARFAAEQKSLLEKSAKSLELATDSLQRQAESSESSKQYLAKQYSIEEKRRSEELAERSKTPSIMPGLELVLENGTTREILALDKPEWSNYPQMVEIELRRNDPRFELVLRAINVGSKPLRDGYISLSAGFQNDLRMNFSGIEAYLQAVSVPLKNVRPMRESHSFVSQRVTLILPPPPSGNSRTFNMFLHCEGDETQTRRANVWFRAVYK